ncbi:hypothetical protein X963_3567 [Burkholderia pseudomallei MSHR7498]|nr:hypothetical protein X963_3567 [Burkholderia pseudomallei MSHR7498]
MRAGTSPPENERRFYPAARLGAEKVKNSGGSGRQTARGFRFRPVTNHYFLL